ncbi:GNAT family N-acetyltransferase [Sediminitomix flava]|nr:GNAT family N-acetyltransferase [Sediminitomix flava]
MNTIEEIKVVNYTPDYQKVFRALNVEWIQKYFKMEESDYKALDKPNEYILDRGGAILVALYNGEAVGVCSLIKMDDPIYDFELAKMAVSPKVQGKGIGKVLLKATIEKGKELGARNLYLESNRKLNTAIKLYEKMGFKEVLDRNTPYERADIFMEYLY